MSVLSTSALLIAQADRGATSVLGAIHRADAAARRTIAEDPSHPRATDLVTLSSNPTHTPAQHYAPPAAIILANTTVTYTVQPQPTAAPEPRPITHARPCPWTIPHHRHAPTSHGKAIVKVYLRPVDSHAKGQFIDLFC
jgi:hypothetical protein